MRVLEWIVARCFGEVDAVETPIGSVPNASDINIEGLDMTPADIEALLTIDKDA